MRSVLSLLRTPAVQHLAILYFTAVAAASAVDTWGVRFLRVEHDTSVVGGAGAYAVAQLVAVGARLRLVAFVELRRVEPVVRGQRGCSPIGLIIECTTSSIWSSAAGLAVAAVASALVVPLLLARSGIGARPAAAVAAVGAVGQLGFVAGPALVGATDRSRRVSRRPARRCRARPRDRTAERISRLVVDGPARVNDSVIAMTRRVERT